MPSNSDQPSERARIGDLIDSRYRVLEELGRGGMGAVYRAEHVFIKRPVAVKLLHPALSANADMAQRFEREAIACGRLTHPNCVEISDFGRLEDGTLYLAMELLQGRSLRELLSQQGRLSVPRAVHIAQHVLRGLQHAHGLGVIHRDIKPDNIFLVEHEGDADFAKVLDFGIAKLADGTRDGADLTQTGVAIGTPTYLAPEQAFGGDIDARTDLYALSVVLFEILAGRPPFVGKDGMAVVSQHLTAEVPPLAAVAADAQIPPGLEAVLRRGLAKQREERIETAETYLAALAPWAGANAKGGAPSAPSAGEPAAQPSRPIGTSATVAQGVPAPARASTPVIATPVPSHVPLQERQASSGGATGMQTPAPAPITGTVTGNVTTDITGARAPSAASGQLWPRIRRPLLIAAALIGIPVLAWSLLGPSRDEALKAAIHDLRNADTCEERLAAVQTLRLLGDRRAIGPLKKARRRMRGGLLGIGDKNTNDCLADAAEAAIELLETMPKN